MEVNVSDLKRNDKVLVVYGDGAIDIVGFVSSVTDKHLVIHEHVSDTYRTSLIENIVELSLT